MRRIRARVAAAVLLGGLVAACSSVEITAPPLQVIEQIEFHPSLNVTLSAMTPLESGIYIQDLEEGEGPVAEAQNTVRVGFEGWVATTGQKFVEDEAGIILGVGEIPAGLDQAIQGMKAGGRRRAVVPPLLGYGRIPNGIVPGGSVLVYEIHLFEIF